MHAVFFQQPRAKNLLYVTRENTARSMNHLNNVLLRIKKKVSALYCMKVNGVLRK